MDFPDGQGVDDGGAILRTPDGERVFDVGDVDALLALNQIEATLVIARFQRLRAMRRDILSFREAHLVDFGHEWGHGCCRTHSRPSAVDADAA